MGMPLLLPIRVYRKTYSKLWYYIPNRAAQVTKCHYFLIPYGPHMMEGLYAHLHPLRGFCLWALVLPSLWKPTEASHLYFGLGQLDYPSMCQRMNVSILYCLHIHPAPHHFDPEAKEAAKRFWNLKIQWACLICGFIACVFKQVL
jgi:hypothetical protein